MPPAAGAMQAWVVLETVIVSVPNGGGSSVGSRVGDEGDRVGTELRGGGVVGQRAGEDVVLGGARAGGALGAGRGAGRARRFDGAAGQRAGIEGDGARDRRSSRSHRSRRNRRCSASCSHPCRRCGRAAGGGGRARVGGGRGEGGGRRENRLHGDAGEGADKQHEAQEQSALPPEAERAPLRAPGRSMPPGRSATPESFENSSSEPIIPPSPALAGTEFPIQFRSPPPRKRRNCHQSQRHLSHIHRPNASQNCNR